MIKEMIIALVQPGDTVKITPNRKMPKADRTFKVDAVLESGFLYGCSTTCDGYVMPFTWIKDIKIVASAGK